MSSRYINMNDYRNFSVQIKNEEGYWGWLISFVDYAEAQEVAELHLDDKARIWGHHATARGGAGDTVVWDSRD